jgi:hypothetical protein
VYGIVKNNIQIPERVSVPISLYKSLRGQYFAGYADQLTFGKGTSAWAGLYNPRNSKMNLYVNVWTVADISESPFRAQIWFNASPAGIPTRSSLVTPANTSIIPAPRPKTELLMASSVTGAPSGGIKAFVRRGAPETTMVVEEDGKFIFGPGGLFLVFLSNPETPDIAASGRIAFGWWEEPINEIAVPAYLY